MSIASAPNGIRYDLPGICFFEVYKDGTVYRIDNSRRAICYQNEDSTYQAYFRALKGESNIYFSYADSNGNVFLYKADDLDALADSIGIIRPSDHVHNIRWSYSKEDPGKGRYACLDIEFLCGCKLSNTNKRIMAKQQKDMFGWDVILSSIDSNPSSKRTIRVERKSIRG